MKFKEKLQKFLFVMLLLGLSYSLCQNHESDGKYRGRRKAFCSTPFYIIILLSLLLVFFSNS